MQAYRFLQEPPSSAKDFPRFKIQSLRARGEVIPHGSFFADYLARVDQGLEFWKLNLKGISFFMFPSG